MKAVHNVARHIEEERPYMWLAVYTNTHLYCTGCSAAAFFRLRAAVLPECLRCLCVAAGG
jgi:hypothetical protein